MNPIKIIAFSLLITFTNFNSGHAQSIKGKKPNIIFVLTDDQGKGDLSCMGNKVLKTPNIDAFYAKSTRFTDFQVSPTCAPTRAALMSGNHEFRAGVTHTIMQRERMNLNVFTFPQALQSAGYKTALFGKWHLGDEEKYLPYNRGFDEVLMLGGGGIGQTEYGDFPPNEENVYFDNVLLHNDMIVQTKGFCTDLFFDATLGWIKQQNKSEQPFFAYVSLNAPHGPFVAPDNYTKRFLDIGYDEKTAGRYGMIENIDDNFGYMMRKLEEWDVLDNTLVIFMTDNGAVLLSGTLNGKRVEHFNANLRGTKNTPYEGGTRVPSFWYWKGVLGEGVDVDALTAHVDLYKTFCELAGVEIPSGIQNITGRSLVPLLENKNTQWSDRDVFIHCGRWPLGDAEDAKFNKMAVRTEEWRFVNNKELYNIPNDRSEENNVADQHPEVVKKLKKTYDKWWSATLPLMVNENLPVIKSENQPLAKRYYKQLKEQGIPDWEPLPIED